ncbi:DNA-binding protein [Thermococcus barossii]|uniref:DNA-binding protein n=1 Tax=Thermococcus barossii TaxID=54077 RepID=A0A2Z2ML83_9EURY|nr:DNA-binding protein [Thermococcus barossii]ASJ05505.1 DNA-binding protein [Thermococcus barossii]
MTDIETQVLEWLRTGREDAADIVDLPWEVKAVDESMYVAEHPKMPFTLVVMFSDEFVHLVIPTSLETYGMSDEDRLYVYHTLLELNDRIYMMKFSLGRPNDVVNIRVDLDKKTLGKEEFNDALTALAVGLLSGVSALGLEEEFVERIFDRIVVMLLERIQKGYTYEQLIEFLTIKVGLEEKDAKELLDAVLEAVEEEPTDEEG